jgi:zinc D-Ala-D-Ala dipeptidase
VTATVVLAVLALSAEAMAPPSPRADDLVEIVTLDPTIHLDIRYATERNFVGRAVYEEARAFLRRPAAEALVRAHRRLGERGFGIVVFDAYRPWSVTKLFWDLTPPGRRAFVADPKKGSKHNRGCAVDVTLYDLGSGEPLPMPSDYDDFSPRAAPGYEGGTDAERAHREALRRAMEKEGFRVEPNEWWHFNYKSWRAYPILDVRFDELERESAAD